ncbi:antibiotic biosynthesis monooxygenase [Vibrio sp. DW001]|uniref:putative quinol monooxygenase n=1 Tax=Vibrio sp. DW001 TaxID=2912315 RepID=UPI0023B0FFB2|nr:antibiotic biosynthesis monooxygenase [Vibrio sp. DW001]WED27774.1 antibiotic biosynthesis monooxygenase [Vibrio sp. DW001]
MDKGLFITAEIRIKEDVDYDHALLAIKAFCVSMNSEEGCTMAIPMKSKTDSRQFIFWERYEDEAAYEKHFRAEHTQKFIKQGFTDLVSAYQTYQF